MRRLFIAAEAELAQLPSPPPHSGGSSGIKRDRLTVSGIRMVWGPGRQLPLGPSICRLARGRHLYSVGLGREELELLRMQTLIVPIVILGVFLPLLERMRYDWLLDGWGEDQQNGWRLLDHLDEWSKPLPVNGCVGLIVWIINAVQLGIWHTMGLPKRCGRLGALNALAAVRGYHTMVSYAPRDASERAHALASAINHSGFNVWLDTYRLENAFNLKQA
ncbi:MAG: hypothetical protein SGPRY_007785, partial [Prymnesium sp.]